MSFRPGIRRYWGNHHRHRLHRCNCSNVRIAACRGFHREERHRNSAASPAGSVGTVDRTVTTPGGTSLPGPADLFTYSDTNPVPEFPSPALPARGGVSGYCIPCSFKNRVSPALRSGCPARTGRVAGASLVRCGIERLRDCGIAGLRDCGIAGDPVSARPLHFHSPFPGYKPLSTGM